MAPGWAAGGLMRPGSGLGDGAWVLSIDWSCAGESIRPIALGYESRTSARGWGPPGGPRQPRHTHQPGDAAGGGPSPPKVCVLRCSLGQSEERGYKSNRCGGGRQRTSRRRPTEPSKARVVQSQPLEEAAATAPWHRQAGPGGAPFWINPSVQTSRSAADRRSSVSAKVQLCPLLGELRFCPSHPRPRRARLAAMWCI